MSPVGLVLTCIKLLRVCHAAEPDHSQNYKESSFHKTITGYRMVYVGKDFQRSVFPPCCHEQGHFLLDHIAQSPV